MKDLAVELAFWCPRRYSFSQINGRTKLYFPGKGLNSNMLNNYDRLDDDGSVMVDLAIPTFLVSKGSTWIELSFEPFIK